MNSRKSKTTLLLATLLFFLTVLMVFNEEFYFRIGNMLVCRTPLVPADAIVVLSGSSTGKRLMGGVKLFKNGYGKYLVTSGVEVYPEVFDHVLIAKHAVRMGVPENKIIMDEIKEEKSTWGEALTNLKMLNERGLNSFIVVTSDYHSQRSRWVYEKAILEKGYDMNIYVYPVKESSFSLEGWWNKRAHAKILLMEYLKIAAFFIEH